MTALSLQRISKRFGDLIANDDISLTVNRGEVLALLGENGAGKSTLMNILFGHYVPDSGSISVFGETLTPGKPQEALARGVGMVHQHFTLADNLSVLDNVMLGSEKLTRVASGRAAARERLLALSTQFSLTVSPDALIRSLSVGEKQRVEILKALYRGARILILDEPTSVLTPNESAALFATLKRLVADGLSIIFISHKLDEVLALSHRIVVLRQGKLVHECALATATKEGLALAMVGREITKPRRNPPSCGAEGLGQRVLAAQSNLAGTHTPSPQPSFPEGGGGALVVDSLCATDEASRITLNDVSLSVRRGEIVAIAGVSGNGQAVLADVLFGLVKPSAGKISVGVACRELGGDMDWPGSWKFAPTTQSTLGRIPEDRQYTGAVGDLSVWENAILPRLNDARFFTWGVLKRAAARSHATKLVKQFDVRLASIELPIRRLSGGNMQKLILGRELSENPDVIVAAQPTWGLDVGAVAFVHEQMLAARDRGAAILMISEDLDEVFALADRVAVMSKGRLSEALPTEAWTRERMGLAMAGEAQQSEAVQAA
jgi:general nucleoside transport system ATP-binding protein